MRRLPLLIALLILITACSAGGADRPPDSGAPAASASTADPAALAAAPAVKIAVAAEGMYRIPLADLGWDDSAAEMLALTRRGEPVPYEVQTTPEGAVILFYGQLSESRYTPVNQYILTQGEQIGAQISAQPAEPPASPAAAYVLRTLHLEENNLYKPTAGGNTWHWAKIVAPGSQTIEFRLPAPADAPAALRLSLWGATRAPTSPAHHLRVRVNGQEAAEAAWDGQTWQRVAAELPAGVLRTGENTLEIQATGEVDALVDIIHLDWVEIDYPQLAGDLGAQAIFRLPPGTGGIRGIPGGRALYEVGSPPEISRLTFPPKGAADLEFQGNPAKRYILVAPDGFLAPQSIQPLTLDPDLRAASGADYLVIGDPALLEPLAPLLEARRGQGLTVMTVPLAAVYDQFNGGMAEPEAIRAFLRYAAANWAAPPRYVLLAGDASYDFYGYQTPPQANFLPTFLVETVYGGETASDVTLAQLDDDLHPDLAIGRVPARTPEEIRVFVEKTLAYERTAPAAPWKRTVLAVADGSEPSFAEDARRFLALFPAPWESDLLAPPAGAEGVDAKIAARFGDGVFLAAYFGHGSVNLWGRDALLTAEEAAALQNGENLPVVLNFTCLTGLFTQPEMRSLAEALLLNPEGGAVAVLAPTSPTLPGDQSFLSDAFAAALLDDSRPRLGDVTLAAWRQVPVEGAGATDVMLTFLLFGDPALVLP